MYLETEQMENKWCEMAQLPRGKTRRKSLGTEDRGREGLEMKERSFGN